MIYRKGVSFCYTFSVNYLTSEKNDNLLSQIHSYGEQPKELENP